MPDSVEQLRVLTANIHHGEGTDGQLDLDRIAAVIRRAGPDVVGLQEVDRHFGGRSGFADQARDLGRALGMTALFEAGVRLPPPAPGRPDREYGVALLTALPVSGRCRVSLPTRPGDETRVLLLADVETAAGTVRVGCTHLSVESADARREQARLLTEMADGPVVLLGDLNAEPDSEEMAVLTGRLVDCWDAAGHGPGATFPDDAPARRIDDVLAAPSLEATGAEVVPMRGASDHRAVLVTLRLPERRWRVTRCGQAPGAAR